MLRVELPGLLSPSSIRLDPGGVCNSIMANGWHWLANFEPEILRQTAIIQRHTWHSPSQTQRTNAPKTPQALVPAFSHASDQGLRLLQPRHPQNAAPVVAREVFLVKASLLSFRVRQFPKESMHRGTFEGTDAPKLRRVHGQSHTVNESPQSTADYAASDPCCEDGSDC